MWDFLNFLISTCGINSDLMEFLSVYCYDLCLSRNHVFLSYCDKNLFFLKNNYFCCIYLFIEFYMTSSIILLEVMSD